MEESDRARPRIRRVGAFRLMIRYVTPATTQAVQTQAQTSHQMLTGDRSINSAVLAVIPFSEPMMGERKERLMLKESIEVGER